MKITIDRKTLVAALTTVKSAAKPRAEMPILANVAAAATTHKVSYVDHKPVIQAGQPVTVAALEELMTQLGRKTGVNYLSDRVVSVGMDRVVWWCPAGRRRIWFKPPAEKKYDALRKLNGKFVHHPPLLFIANGSLHVYALAQDQRPLPETQLWRAPYWNLDDQGHMCRGNIHLPTASPESIADFEKAFFHSAFTHHTSGQLLTRHPGGHDAFWKHLSELKRPPALEFWKDNLIDAKQTLSQILK